MGVLGKRLAFVFPGQGSQAVGMGKDLAENYPAAREIFERADTTLGCPLMDTCFNGPEEKLRQTVFTQPALYTTSAAACEVVKAQGLEPIVTAGHSVGEYAALYAAGAFSFEEGLNLVATRARLMQNAAEDRPGTMAAILGLSPEQVVEVVDKAKDAGVIDAANFNSPIQTVISGEEAAVKRASEIASEMGAKRVVPLNVSGAFHSALMQPAADALLEAVNAAQMEGSLRVPVIANYTGDVETLAEEVRMNLAKQVTGSVRWVDSVQRMLDLGAEVFLELGSGNVLAGLIKRIAAGAEVYSVGDKASVEQVA